MPVKRRNPIDLKATLEKLADEVFLEMRRIGFNPNTSFKQGKDKIYKIILSTAGINTWPKKKAYKECTLKKFYNTFIRNVSTHYDSIVPVNGLTKTPSGCFTKNALKIVSWKLHRTFFGNLDRTAELYFQATLKMFGLKKWDKSKFEGNMTFSHYFKNYILKKKNVSICRRKEDFFCQERVIHKTTPFIDYLNLTYVEPIIHKGKNECCSICLDKIDYSKPNEVFTTCCNHSFHYECIKEGQYYLFTNYTNLFKCPFCRQLSNFQSIKLEEDYESDGDYDDSWMYRID